MIQQRKKDYLQRLIEEFTSKLEALKNVRKDDSEVKKATLNTCFQFFFDNFEIKRTDSSNLILEKLAYHELSEQYASLLKEEYELQINNNRDELKKALAIIEFLEKSDSTYSWDRTVLREDILKLIDNKETV